MCQSQPCRSTNRRCTEKYEETFTAVQDLLQAFSYIHCYHQFSLLLAPLPTDLLFLSCLRAMSSAEAIKRMLNLGGVALLTTMNLLNAIPCLLIFHWYLSPVPPGNYHLTTRKTCDCCEIYSCIRLELLVEVTAIDIQLVVFLEQ